MTSATQLDRRGAALIGGCLLILSILGVSVGYVELRRAHPPSDGETVILLDCTDPLSVTQKQGILSVLRGLEDDTLRPGDHVTLYALGGGEDGGLERVFNGQFPGRHVNPLIGNEDQQAGHCDTVFTAPLRTAASDAMQTGTSPRSPLLESIEELSEQPELRSAIRRRFIVISNLLQNVPGLSFYRICPSFQNFQRSAGVRSTHADLHGVAIEVRYFPGLRDEIESSKLRLFWRQYFIACGATDVRLERL
jgi:hypothetical protein